MRDGDKKKAAILDHYTKAWPGYSKRSFAPGAPFVPDMEVVRFEPPRNSGEAWVYASLGASAAVGCDGVRMEFYLLALEEQDGCADIIAMLASFNADPNFGVECGSIVDIGMPWTVHSSADHLLVSLPYDLGPDHEWCHVPNENVRILWLVPITKAEADFARREGVDSLEEKMEEAEVWVMDPRRPEVV